MITCIVIDDQQEAIDVLASHIQNKQELLLVETFTNPLEAMNYLENKRVDIVFIDIQMPHLNGLEFIETLRAKKGNDVPKFVFTTGFSDYALSGFENGVSDYLLKPIGVKRFNIAVDRMLVDLKKNSSNTEPAVDFFFADVDGKKVRINMIDIVYIESSGNYITVFGNNLKLLLYKSMNGIQEILDPAVFIRVHKSYIVSINYIETVKGNELALKLGEVKRFVPIGATFKESILKKLRI